MNTRKLGIFAAVAALLLLIYCNNRPEVITDIQEHDFRIVEMNKQK